MTNIEIDDFKELAQDQIHLWCVADSQIDNAQALETYQSWLSAEERVRWQRFYFPRHRHQFLLTRALVRFGLSSYCPSIDPADWRFGKNDYGRPIITNEGIKDFTLEFNLSHTSGLIVLAICRRGELGVDVENHTRLTDPLLLAKRFFSPSEAQDLLELPQTEHRDRFFDYWTLKEAYIKARGMGLAIPLDAFSFELRASSNIGFSVEAKADDEALGWQFWQVRPTQTHKIAVAHRQGEVPAVLNLHYFSVIPGLSIQSFDCAHFRSSL